MLAFTVLNDLGKIKSVIADVEQMAAALGGGRQVDHDKILLDALMHHPEIAPSFARLTPHYQKVIVDGLKPVFNMGQFLQAENVPASLSPLVGLDRDALDFYMIHVLFDIAGAAGHGKQNGSVIMTEPTYHGFRAGIEALGGLAEDKSVKQVYDGFLRVKADGLDLPMSSPTERAVVRLACMMRLTSPAEGKSLADTYASLSANTRAILDKELNVAGIGDGFATLLYYAPAALANAKKAFADTKHPDPLRAATASVLPALARAFQAARIELKGRGGDGVFKLDINDLAKAAGSDPTRLAQLKFTVERVGDDAVLRVADRSRIDASKFPPMALADVPGKRVVTIGIGGGSDVIQAAMLARLLRGAGKDTPAIISVRTDKTGSQGASGNVGEQRTIENADLVAPGVYRVKAESTGSGRFLENIPTADAPVYLVIDAQDDTLSTRLRQAVKAAGGADTVVGVDTGGDALFSSGAGQDGARATPDQDLRVLGVLGSLGVHAMSAEVATGVDTPNDAEAVLRRAGARYFGPSSTQSADILDAYRSWRMDGSDESRYGKTPLAWQAALGGGDGYTAVPLPTRIVVDGKNPWDPFVPLDASMRGVFFMDAKQHLAAIGANG